MKKAITAIIVAAAAALAAAFAIMLAGSLINRFSPLPTEYENSVWVSEDGAFTLTVGEYDENTYQCPAEIVYRSPSGKEAAYSAVGAELGVISVYEDPSLTDDWLRVKCDESSFTARINRTASLAYAEDYEKNQEIKFRRAGD